MKKIVIGALCLSMVGVFIACKKNKKPVVQPAPTTETATLQITGSSNASITYAAAFVAKDTLSSEKNINKSSWKKDIKHKKGQKLSFTVKARVTDGKDGTLEAQILRNGKVVKTSKVTGKDLKTTVSE